MYDESIDVLNAEEVQSPRDSESSGEAEVRAPMKTEQPPILRPASAMKMQLSEHQTHIPLKSRNNSRGDSSFDDESEDEDDDETEGEMEGGAERLVAPNKAYNPQEYAHLATTSEMKEMFDYITKYTPQPIDLDYKLKPFIPDYIPAVGDIDAFIKIPRPDGKPDELGLTVLDEPCYDQSDPAILNLQLRQNTTGPAASRTMVIKKVEDADNNKKAIDRWIKDIGELHKSKPPPSIHYSRGMPDIDHLMQEWSTEVEQALTEVGIPAEDLDCDLNSYIDIMAAILDIPRFESRVETLHMIFSLYGAIEQSSANRPFPAAST